LATVRGLDCQIPIDATNNYGDRPAGFDSLAQQVKSKIGGPTAKAFNTNVAALYDKVDAETVRPGTMLATDPEARETTEQLIRDAGLDPIHVGDLVSTPANTAAEPGLASSTNGWVHAPKSAAARSA